MKIILLIAMLSSSLMAAECSLYIKTNNASAWKVKRAFEDKGFNILSRGDQIMINTKAQYTAELEKKTGLELFVRGTYYRTLTLKLYKGNKLLTELQTRDEFPGNFMIYSMMRRKIRESKNLTCL